MKEPLLSPEPPQQLSVLFLQSEALTAEVRIRPLFELLGIDRDYAPDDQAPAIDERRLLAFIRDALSQEERHAVIRLIARFRSWHNAWGELVRRERQDRQP